MSTACPITYLDWRRPRPSRAPSSTRSRATTPRWAPTCTAASTRSARRRRRRTSARATPWRRSSAPRRARSSSRATPPSRSTWSRRASGLDSDDEVVFPASEHHSNYMPWRLKAKTVLVDIDDEAVPRYQQLKERLSPRTRLVTLAHVSNVTGVVAPVEEWIATAHAAGVPVMVDASQSIVAPADRRQEARLRLPGLLVAQDLRPLGRRRALRAQGSLREAAAVERRRRHGQLPRRRSLRGARGALPLRGGHAQHRRRHRPRRGDRLRAQPPGWTRSPRTRARSASSWSTG